MAAVTVALALLFSSFAWGAEDPILVSGPPAWLATAADRAAEAVWSELSHSGLSRSNALRTLDLVASRLFSGYEVRIYEGDSGVPSIELSPKEILRWEADLDSPDLQAPLSDWMASDGEAVKAEILKELSDVPYQALTWGDDALRSLIRNVMKEKMPGWKGGVVIRIKDDVAVLALTVTPDPPLILASDPAIYSETLPNILMDRLEESLLKDLSPLMGLPVTWVEYHKDGVNRWVYSLVVRRNTVAKSKAETKISVRPRQITKVDASVESRRYVLRAWLASQAGADGRYPELGLHLGRFAEITPGWNSEIYGEFLVDLENWSLESRLGLRWNLIDPIWVGFEYDDPDDEFWYRVWIKGHRKGPYFWWRYSENDENQLGLGYRINQVISVELDYDDRYDDRWSLRAVGDL